MFPKERSIHVGAAPAPDDAECFYQVTTRSPQGQEITADCRSLRLDGRPWLPVMGEFHYARSPQKEWRDALLRIKAGGIDIVASYVFWIHHEEEENVWDWSGSRDLRQFVTLCGELGLLFAARIGPWCHGEVRNGGLPDWILGLGPALRSDDPRYLRPVRRLYRQIAHQLSGLLWKEGGPVVSVQCENEYSGPAEHLLSLKRLAVEAGLDVPLYTRTGWPELATPMPLGELLPLYGGYPDGFWDRSTREMPCGYRGAYLFTHIRADAAIATDQLGERDAAAEDARYPYFACEIGGGMERSYHRRIRIAPADIEALALVKIGSGNNLQGYYMYHGGTNPEGRLSTLQESQATGYWNDLPVKSYDFQAPLGEFGQVREHYHRLRRLHLFLRDFGALLAPLTSALPGDHPHTADDTRTLRWAVRTDGESGFLFVNNFQRLQPMPSHEGIQFHICLPDGPLCLPSEPITVPADSAFFWPFRLNLGGAMLTFATAQPVCTVEETGTLYYVFRQTPGVPTEFVFEAEGVTVEEAAGRVETERSSIRIRNVSPGTGAAVKLCVAGQSVSLILLDEEHSLRCWKMILGSKERLFLTQASLIVDGEVMRLRSPTPEVMSVAIFPPSPFLSCDGAALTGVKDGLFSRYTLPPAAAAPVPVTWELVQQAGPARTMTLGAQGVAEAPSDTDFAQAAVWRLQFPMGVEARRHLRLNIRYIGDVARLCLNGTLLTDNFYNGSIFEVGLSRDAPEIDEGDLRLEILPLRRDAPIYLPGEAWPDFGDTESIAAVLGIEVVEEHEATLHVG